MPTPQLDEATSRFDVKADATTHFAWLRTCLAVERLGVPSAAKWPA